jgi:hypothetical protein
VKARPTERLGVNFAVVRADVDLDLQASERSEGVDSSGAPFNREVIGSGNVDQDRALYDLGLDYGINDRVSVFARLRRVELEQSAASVFEDAAASDWDIETLRLEAGAELAVAQGLRVAAGWTVEQRDVSLRQQVAGEAGRDDRDTDADGYFARVWYRPSKHADVQLTVEDDSIDDPFTLASPTGSTRYRLRGRYRWDNGVTASASYLKTDRDNANSGWHADSEQMDVRLGYASQRLTLSAGVSTVDLSRTVDSLVIAGSRQALFAIDYGADADFLDAAATWRIRPDLSVGGSFRRYRNAGSFDVERDDARLFLRGVLSAGYQWGVEYRKVDFEEAILNGGREAFDADQLEISVGVRW